MNDLIFKKANIKEVNSLVNFEQLINCPRLYAPPLEIEAARLEITNNSLYFIYKDKILVGTAAYMLRDDNSCYLSNIAVHPEFRGKGFARQATSFLIERATSEGVVKFDLTVHPENYGAISLYESFGFNQTAYKNNFYGDGEPRLIMVRIDTIL